MTGEVVGAGWHDTYFRWDISTPQRGVSRLEQLPGQGSLGQPGKKLYAERDRFGKWQHLLGPQNVLLSYTVDNPTHGRIRRLELQAHLGDSGEDDLCALEEFGVRWLKQQRLMAMIGVLPPEVRSMFGSIPRSKLHTVTQWKDETFSKRFASLAGRAAGTQNGKVLPLRHGRDQAGHQDDCAGVLSDHEA